jgi:hypothetical protein
MPPVAGKRSFMIYDREPAWRYYPQPDRPKPELRQLVDGIASLAG